MNQNPIGRSPSRRSVLRGAAAAGAGLTLSGLSVHSASAIGDAATSATSIALDGHTVGVHDDLYLGPVRVAMTTPDTAARMVYAIDGEEWSEYTKPFVLGDHGAHRLQIRALAADGDVIDEQSKEFVLRPSGGSSVTIGVIADTHVRDTARASIPAWDEQQPTYARFAAAMNDDLGPDFVVQLGDLNDGCVYPTPGPCAANGREPVYSEDDIVRWIGMAKSAIHEQIDALTLDVVGNHEYHEPQLWDEKRILNAINPHWSKTSDTWYAFSYKEMTFIMLNTAYTNTVPSAHTAPIEEVEWLRETLDQTHEPTFVFLHVPASHGCNEPYDQFVNQELISQALAEHEWFVAGFFGHVHHCAEWHRMTTQIDDYGNRFYHVTFPHDWMRDKAQAPWGVVELDPRQNELVFRTGSGVDEPQGFQTRWERPMIRGKLAGNHYLSDLEWSHARNGLGPTELDMSNGGDWGLDGSPITIRGHVYGKGIGVHAPSEIVYRLDGYRGRFIADIGIDDETEGQGSVTFEVWADDTRLYDSGVVTAQSATATVEADLAGFHELRLVVTDAGDGNTGDHADWANARLQSKAL